MVYRLKTKCATCGKPFVKPRTWAYCSKKCQHHRLGWLKRRGRPDIEKPQGPADEYLTLQAKLESAHQYDRDAILRRMYVLRPPNHWVGNLVSQVAQALDQIHSMAPLLMALCVERLQGHLDKRRAQLPPPPPTNPQ